MKESRVFIGTIYNQDITIAQTIFERLGAKYIEA